MADKLALVAARIISPNQYGFVQGREIQDCIGIAYATINMLSKNFRGGNVTYKVDIYKAFDTLSWKFLLLFLTRFGFHSSFVGWISTILHSTMLFIRINGSLVGFYLAIEVSDKVILCLHYFFCLAEEVLSRGISKLCLLYTSPSPRD